MLFTSFEFAIFLPIVFFLYWIVAAKNKLFQNIILLFSSYVFYGWWDYRFLFLLLFSTSLDYFSGLKIYQAQSPFYKRMWLIISVSINLGFLGFFKYYNFFLNSFSTVLQSIGFNPHISAMSIILPVGISFYTFHGLSYVFDIYNGKCKPTKNIVEYSLFVNFFPLLVAGPIERATHFLPQIKQHRKFDYTKAVDGLRQILWGLFKKLVIADNCANYVNIIFNGSSHYSGSTLVIGAVFFAFQIYGDFSGYSDIALGTARLFGFELLQNFNFPYFSRDIAEFWRRWHISLSSWFKDYLYIPLGGSRGDTWFRIRNTFIIFLVSGFWHGANWTFLVWGFLHAMYIVPSVIFKTNRNNLEIVAKGKIAPSIKEFLQILLTFALTVFAWIFFRANTITQALNYIKNIFSHSLFHKPAAGTYSRDCILWIIVFMTIEWLGRENRYAIESINKIINNRLLRWTVYVAMSLVILWFINLESNKPSEFIYFQF
jgi:alginate O-acetyltransferase complex protein AlgI